MSSYPIRPHQLLFYLIYYIYICVLCTVYNDNKIPIHECDDVWIFKKHHFQLKKKKKKMIFFCIQRVMSIDIPVRLTTKIVLTLAVKMTVN